MEYSFAKMDARARERLQRATRGARGGEKVAKRRVRMSSEGNTAREGERTSETSASAMGASTSKTAEKKTFLGPFAVISLAYILFTTTDGAVRMLVLMHAYAKGFTAMEVAIMFTLYELCGAGPISPPAWLGRCRGIEGRSWRD